MKLSYFLHNVIHSQKVTTVLRWLGFCFVAIWHSLNHCDIEWYFHIPIVIDDTYYMYFMYHEGCNFAISLGKVAIYGNKKYSAELVCNCLV